ncbi:hypothetical protein L208DRAFT_1375521 [Tricholoma matsutake]|nr:hypothetical protein L208DRAFT_1375521 [Tricholoma matsutake 945]
MPTSTRKSSLGAARRGPQKAHIPYRGDNPEVGKKTGIAVRHVERKSDGFEPFEEIMEQADKRTPPKPKGRNRKSSVPIQEDESDEDGEMSMELDDAPMQYFANTQQPSTPRRTSSSSRPVTRTSDIDFDQVPSPRPRGSSRKSVSGPGPSNLSKSYHARDLQRDQDSDPPDNDAQDHGGMDDNDAFEDHGQPNGGPPPQDSPQHQTSFTQMDQDDNENEGEGGQGDGGHEQEEEEEEEHQTPLPPLRRNKGKERAVLPDVPEEEEEGLEDEIARGMQDVEQQRYDDDDGGEEDDHAPPEPRQSKKAKVTNEDTKKPGRPRAKSKKENRDVREGVRKSTREHYKPLEWWRGEKLVYGRPRGHSSNSGLVLVPPIREIIRIPKEEPEPLGSKRKRNGGRGRSKSKATEEVQVKMVPVDNPEEGWDDETDPYCTVLDYPTREEVRRRVAFPSGMLNPRPTANGDWSFEKVFGDGDFIAAGVLIIPPKGRKPSKVTKDNTYIFYVVEGAVNLKVHETSLILATGAIFLVPRGNTYFIENISQRDAKLFFTQARKIAPSVEELEAADAAVVHRLSSGATVARTTSTAVGVDGGTRQSSGPRPSTVAPTTQVDGVVGRVMSKVPAGKRAMSTRT